jgi:hypothetical protein
MSGFSLKFASVLLTASLCVPGLASTAAAQKGGVRKLPKKQRKQEQPTPPPLPAYTPAPLQPLPLDQVPAVAPRVQYSGGELTIVAHNSTLADVLKAVRQQTGADFDIPPNASERVVADLGPGPARDVLAELLNGTHFNYVMVGSATDPTAVQSIVLTSKSGPPDTTTATTSRPGAPQRGFPGASVVPAQPADAAPAMENDGADEADTPDDQPEQADQQNPQNPTQQTPKTPEQLLQELQRQQQQQQQQQQNPQSGQPPQGILPNQPPTAAPPTPNKPD